MLDKAVGGAYLSATYADRTAGEPLMANRFESFLGDSPLRLLVRLIVLSLVVGVVLAALGIEPRDIVSSAIDFVHHIWSMGFDAIDKAWRYFLLGAVVVIPVWLVLRLLNAGRNRF